MAKLDFISAVSPPWPIRPLDDADDGTSRRRNGKDDTAGGAEADTPEWRQGAGGRKGTAGAIDEFV